MSLPVALLKGHAALEAATPDWSRLVKASGAPVFMTAAWARAWLEHLAPTAEPWLLAAGDPPIALWPLALQRKRGIRVLGSLGHGISDYLGPIGENPSPDLVAALGARVRAERGAYDLLDLGSLLLSDRLRDVLHQHLGRATRERVYERCPVISTEGSWDDYLRSRTRKFRANLKRAERRASASGEPRVGIERYGGTLFEELVSVERDSWKWQAGTAYLQHQGRHGFLRAVLSDPEIPSEIWTCRIGDELAAF